VAQDLLTTVVIVDDHGPFRAAARRMLEAAGGFVIVGEAADADEALAVVATSAPDVVLLDVHLPGTDGIAVAERLAVGRDPPRVVLISSRDAAAYGERLTRAPACGFIPKSRLTGRALAALVR
jgi:DNA-binding NarL/FixJ family response regulator